jgi:hypothetical protein
MLEWYDWSRTRLNPPRSMPLGGFTVWKKTDFRFARYPRRKRRGIRSLSRFNHPNNLMRCISL